MKANNKRFRCTVNGINRRKHRKQIFVHPIVRRYFYLCPQDVSLLDKPYLIRANQFKNDEGKDISVFRTFGKTGYTNLFINGVMQGGGLYLITSNSLQLIPTGQMINKGTPIIIEAIGFQLIKAERKNR